MPATPCYRRGWRARLCERNIRAVVAKSKGRSVQKTFQVPGVSCQNCVRHVTDELVKIPGVHDVVVDLTAKTVTVDLDATVTDEQIREGIEEAGYEVAA